MIIRKLFRFYRRHYYRKEMLATLLLTAVCVVVYVNGGSGGAGYTEAFIGLAIGGAAASLASGLIGSIGANKRRRKAEELIDKQKRSLDAWRNAEMNTNYLDRADSRAAMRRVFEYNKEAQKAMDTDAVKRGMTDEAKVAQAARLNRNVADTVSQISAMGAQHKDAVQQQYMNETRNLENLKISNLMDSSGADNMLQGVTGAVGGLGQALSGVNFGRAGSVDLSGVASAAKSGLGMPKPWQTLGGGKWLGGYGSMA